MLDRTSIALLAVLVALAAFGIGGLVTDLSGADPAPSASPTPAIPDFALAPARPAEPEAPPAPPITIALGGDVHGEEQIGELLAAGGDPFAGVADVLGAADLAVVNLETAVGTAGDPAADKQFTFQADPALLDRLADSGVDVVTMANNHALDFGVEGAAETVALAEAAGLAVVGYGEDRTAAYTALVEEVGGRSVAVIGLTRVMPLISWAAGEDRPGMASAYDRHLAIAVAAVEAAAAVADHVVVSVHWGRERHTCPDGSQLALARALADAGADVIAGHHAHVLQGIEVVGDALVAYGLGNLAFYARTPATRQSGVLTVTLGEGGVEDHRWSPAVIDDLGRPQPVATQAPIPEGEVLVTTGSGPACGPPAAS